MISDVLVTKLVRASGTRDNRQGTVITVNETDTLKCLIEKARRERDASARQLAKQAQDAEFKIVGTTLNAIESGTYKSRPSDETIRAIGWLAGVSDDVAFTAAERRNPGPPFASELPPGVDDLSPTERRTALAVLRTLVAQRQEINRYEDTSTQTSTPSDPEAGSSARIGASIEGLARDLNKTQIRALKSVTKAIVERPEHAETETVAMTAWFMKQVTDLADERAERAARYDDVRLMMPTNDDKSGDATNPIQASNVEGEQSGNELARRPGETEDEWRRRTQPQPQPQPKDEHQGTAPDDGA